MAKPIKQEEKRSVAMKQTKLFSKVPAIFLSLVLALALSPVCAFAETPLSGAGDDANDQTDLGTVTVVFKNETYTDGVQFQGSAEVDLTSTSTMQSCIEDALKQLGWQYNITDTEYGPYLVSVKGLSAGDGGEWAGWCIFLNNWACSKGMASYTVQTNTLADGDVISVEYSCDGGTDVKNIWGNTDTSIEGLSFVDRNANPNHGVLDKNFSPDVYSYTLTFDTSVSSVNLRDFQVANRAFQTRVFTGDTPQNEYRISDSIPVTDGTVITIKHGYADPSSDVATDVTTYTFTVKTETIANFTTGDVNANKTINIVDAQIAYDLASGVYGADYSKFELPGGWTIATVLFAADANNDGEVDAADAFAIQGYALRGAWS